MDDTLKGKNLFLEKDKKIASDLIGYLIDSELVEMLSVTTEVKTEYPLSALMHSTIKTVAIATIATITWKPWIVRIVAIVQSNFWTMMAIATIVTII